MTFTYMNNDFYDSICDLPGCALNKDFYHYTKDSYLFTFSTF
jgi:hypothetical protein